MAKKEKALVLFSGGLDSRLVVKLLQEKGTEVEAVFFKLPFGGGCCNNEMCIFKFSQSNYFKLHILDCTKGKLLEEYLYILKNPKYGYGKGINPCIDCKIFMFKKAKELSRKIKADFLATGEVLNQRPSSQTSRALKIIDKEIPNIKRPLIEAGIKGRSRKKQIELAKKFKISFPTPAGGCLLCEKNLAGRFKFLLEKGLINEKTLNLAKIGRHFFLDSWLIVGRNKQENEIIEGYKNSISSEKNKPAVYFHDNRRKAKEKAFELQEAYSTGSVERNKFEKYKI